MRLEESSLNQQSMRALLLCCGQECAEFLTALLRKLKVLFSHLSPRWDHVTLRTECIYEMDRFTVNYNFVEQERQWTRSLVALLKATGKWRGKWLTLSRSSTDKFIIVVCSGTSHSWLQVSILDEIHYKFAALFKDELHAYNCTDRGASFVSADAKYQA